MKPVRYISLLVALPFTFFSLHVYAATTFSGQLQQELVLWSGDATSGQEYQINDGGEHQLDSHDLEGATYLALLSSFYITPNHQGVARFQFDLSSEAGVEQHEAYVGIKNPTSDWRIGTISSPYKSSTASWDPFLATFMQARGNGGASIHHNGYVESAINYHSQWWSTNIELQWSPENGNSLSLLHKGEKWDFAAASIDDQRTAVQSSATKLGLRYRSGEWATVLQHESLNRDSIPAIASFLSLSKQNGKTEYAGSIGRYNSDDVNETNLNYAALGMKHAIAKNSIIHFGYRISSAPDDGSQSEKAVGLGFRFGF